jgi:guanosine-3',5'-bis(diphosphate) 3'-pyrophosphohydrolase
MQMDVESIIGALLHDVLEDTTVNKAEIISKFGQVVGDLVDGVSKLAKIKFENKVEAQANNLRKMMLAMSNDIRVILIKLSDRLHNMRTLSALSREKQRRIALETLEIYAPIAGRLGMNKFRTEFEDLGFCYLYPMRCKVLQDALQRNNGNRQQLLAELETNIQAKLDQENIPSLGVSGREKHLYSLYKKMRKKDLSLTQVMDVYAVRIVTDTISNCYLILGLVHSMYKPVVTRFKDYIAIPKSNGYQSLHSTVFGPFGMPVEIQIRTQLMHNLAEDGIAAHWIYKEKEQEQTQTPGSGTIGAAEIKARKWLEGLLDLDIQKGTGSSKEYLESVKLDLYTEEVYVFTPTGDTLSLQAGATIVDFAYAVHTDLGNSCIAARIDRRLVPLSTKLKSGQTVEIITAKGANPNPAWLGFVVTGKAKHCIRHWLKSQKGSEAQAFGKRLLDMALGTLNLDIAAIKPTQFARVLQELHLANVDKLYEEIGLGHQIAPVVVRKLMTSAADGVAGINQQPVAIHGTEGMVISYSKCCNPIPGDAIIGCLDSGRGIVVHRDSCATLKGVNLTQDKYIFVAWADDVIGMFRTAIRVDVINQQGVLALITKTFAECEANIENIHIDESDARHNSLSFMVQVHGRLHLARIIKNIRKHDIVTKVVRVK